MQIEIITIGDELLLGLTIDTNAAWLARELAAIGVRVVRRASVGDEASAIASAVRDAIERTGAVITTGGLGPTADDMTKPAIAASFGRGMHFDEEAWEKLRERWRSMGRKGEIPQANRQQVTVPDGARLLTNRHGSAPGIFLDDDRGRWVAMLPGVPREMRGLFAEELLPIVRERLGGTPHVVRTHTVRSTGVPESRLPDLLGDAARGIDGMSLAYLPGEEGVDLRLTVRASSVDDADRQLQTGAAMLRERVGHSVYADGTRDLADVVLALCRSRGLRIAVAESCTGGLLGSRLTSIPGSSDVVEGGVIAYDDRVKRSLLGVSELTLAAVGAVSEDVARQMARGVRERLGVAIGVGITGIAGPGGGTPEKPVGLVWVAIDVSGEQSVFGGRLFGDRAEVRFRATQTALEMIRRRLLGIAPHAG